MTTNPDTVAVPVELLRTWSDDLIHIGGFATGQIGQQIADSITDPAPATVAVPVELLERVMRGDVYALVALKPLIPKPTPRLVAFNFDDWCHDSGRDFKSYLAAQPDLLTVLDEAVETFIDDFPPTAGLLKAHIRAALGVTA